MNGLLENKLTEYGYQKAKIAINSGAVYARTAGTTANILVYIEEPMGMRGRIEQFAQIRDKVVEAFINAGFTQSRCLLLMETWRAAEMAHSSVQMAPVWYADSNTGKLMVFEDTLSDFDGLRAVVESAFRGYNYANAGQYAGSTYPGYNPVNGNTGNAGKPKKQRKWTNFREFIAYQGLCNVSIVAINILIFAFMEIIGDTTDAYFMAEHGAAYTPWVANGMYYTLFTNMFLHFGFAHLFGNMIVLFFLGDNLERAVGHVKYLIIYLGAGLLASTISCGVEILTGDYAVSAGASGAIFGVIGALFIIVIKNHNKLEDLNTWKLGIFIAYTLYSGLTSSGVDNTAHIGGLLTGMLLAAIIYRKKQGGQS